MSLTVRLSLLMFARTIVMRLLAVGHCHPHVVSQINRQMGACATNNRYLHDNTVILAEKLAKTLPESLNQIFYTNSG